MGRDKGGCRAPPTQRSRSNHLARSRRFRRLAQRRSAALAGESGSTLRTVTLEPQALMTTQEWGLDDENAIYGKGGRPRGAVRP